MILLYDLSIAYIVNQYFFYIKGAGIILSLIHIYSAKYNDLRDALEKLKLNDASLQFEAETSQALGFGFRCGFLGLLHMDVVQERLEREYNLSLIATAPSVIYHCYLTDGSMVKIDNPAHLPEVQRIERLEEPYVTANIMVPNEYIGAVMELCQNKRGIYKDMHYIDANRNTLEYEIPLGEIEMCIRDSWGSILPLRHQYRPLTLDL